MSARPERRKSILAGSTPAGPNPAHAAPDGGPAPAAAPAPVQAEAAASVPKRLRKVSYYQYPDDTARARAAFLHTQTRVGAPRSLSDFISEAVMEKAQRLEEEFNDGQPWPAIGTGELPQGRPMRG